MAATETVYFSCTKCTTDQYRFWGREYTGTVIVKCTQCGLRYVNPRKKHEEVLKVYGDHYWEAHKLDHPDLKKRKNAFTYDYLSLLKVMEFNRKEDPSLLDIGAGEGGFLKIAKMTGFNRLTGNDINDARRDELGRFDIPLVVGDITRVYVGRYDIINAQHVLEHVLDPFEFLKAIKNALTPGGLAHIVVPNEGGIVARQKSLLSRLGLKKKAFKHLAPGHHLFFYDKRTLRFVLQESGFDILYMGTRNNIKNKGMLYEWVHRLFDRLKWNTHLEVVIRPKS